MFVMKGAVRKCHRRWQTTVRLCLTSQEKGRSDGARRPITEPTQEGNVVRGHGTLTGARPRTMDFDGELGATLGEVEGEDKSPVGVGAGGTTNERYRSIDCNKRSETGRTFPTECDELTEPIPDRVSPVVTEAVPADDTGVMQYQWDNRKSVEMAKILRSRNYLEIPEPRLPRVFLALAEEARKVILVNGQSCDTVEVQRQRTGSTRPVFVAEIVDSTPVLNNKALRVTGTSTEMIPNIKLRGRREPVGPGGPTKCDRAAGLARSTYRREGTRFRGPIGP